MSGELQDPAGERWLSRDGQQVKGYTYGEYCQAVSEGGLRGEQQRHGEPMSEALFEETWGTLPRDRDADDPEDRAYRDYAYKMNQADQRIVARCNNQRWRQHESQSVSYSSAGPPPAYQDPTEETDQLLPCSDEREGERSDRSYYNLLQCLSHPVCLACTFVWVLLLFYLIGMYFRDTGYWLFIVIIPTTLCGMPFAMYQTRGWDGVLTAKIHGVPLIVVGVLLSIMAVLGVCYGVRAGYQLLEAERVIAGGEERNLCPSSNPGAEHLPSVRWLDGSRFASDGMEHGLTGEVKWTESSKYSSTNYCLTVSPVLAPDAAQSASGTSQCVPPKQGPVEVSYWAFYAAGSTTGWECPNADVTARWKTGAIIQDADNMAVLDGSVDFDLHKFGSDLRSYLDSAKSNFLKKYGSGSDYKPVAGKFQFSDHPNSKYVFMTNDPMADAKYAEMYPVYTFLTILGICAFLAAFMWLRASCQP